MKRYIITHLLLLLSIAASIFSSLLGQRAFAVSLSIMQSPKINRSTLESSPPNSFEIALTPDEQTAIDRFLRLPTVVPVGNRNYAKLGFYGTARDDLRSYFAFPLGLPIRGGRTPRGEYEFVRLSDGATVTARSYSNTGFPTLEITLRTGTTYKVRYIGF